MDITQLPIELSTCSMGTKYGESAKLQRPGNGDRRRNELMIEHSEKTAAKYERKEKARKRNVLSGNVEFYRNKWKILIEKGGGKCNS